MHGERTRAGSVATWTASILVLLVAVGLLLMAAWPASAPARWLSMRMLFAQAIAFPRIAGAGVVVLVAGACAWRLRARRSRARHSQNRRSWVRGSAERREDGAPEAGLGLSPAENAAPASPQSADAASEPPPATLDASPDAPPSAPGKSPSSSDRSSQPSRPRELSLPRRLRSVSLGAMALAGALLLAFPVAPPGGAGPRAAHATGTGRQLTVVTLNTQESLTGADLAEIKKRFAPDVLILPETSGYRLERALRDSGMAGQYTAFTATDGGFTTSYTGGIAPTSMLVAEGAGEYSRAPGSRSGPATTFGTVTLESSGGLPRIAGVHTAPPLPSLMGEWSSDLKATMAWGEQAPGPTILAGDFNATLRHGPLAARGRMVDAAEQCGAADRGTWPARMPPWATTPIDHVFVTPDIAVTSCNVASIGRGDHSALAVKLRLP